MEVWTQLGKIQKWLLADRDFGSYIKNKCFRKFLLKADYLLQYLYT